MGGLDPPIQSNKRQHMRPRMAGSEAAMVSFQKLKCPKKKKPVARATGFFT